MQITADDHPDEPGAAARFGPRIWVSHVRTTPCGGFILLAVAFAGMISTAAVAAYGHYEWLATTLLIAAFGTVAGAL